MARKKASARIKKNTPVKLRKTIKQHLLVYFFAILVGIGVFVGGSVIFKPAPPCANSGSCNSDLSLHIDNNAVGIFEGHQVIPPQIDLQHDIQHAAVLGASVSAGEKHIYVDLAAQTLHAYEGTTQVMQAFISSGKWDPTPIGNFHIWEKLRATRMSGGSGEDAYDLPNVPFVMYFYQDFGLHGAYWHDNFGHPMSHGCVNMRDVDAEALYNWADGPTGGQQGTAVSVCNSFSGPNTCIQENPVN